MKQLIIFLTSTKKTRNPFKVNGGNNTMPDIKMGKFKRLTMISKRLAEIYKAR